MIVLIPYVRETFRRRLSPNQAVMLTEFDKLKRVRLPLTPQQNLTHVQNVGLPRASERNPF